MIILECINEVIEVIGLGNILVAAGAIAGFLYWLYHKREPRRQEIRKLEQFFTPTLNLLKGEDQRLVYAIIHTAFPNHLNARINFKGTDGFNDKWTEYKNKYEEIKAHGKTLALGDDGIPAYFEIENDKEELQRNQKYKEELKCLIEELLEAAKK